MKQKLPKALILLIISLTFSAATPQSICGGYNLSYQLLDSPNGSSEYTLNLAVPQSLYEYYHDKEHQMTSIKDFPKFVTPYALKPIAEKLSEIYKGNEENFANGVLMIVHQVSYNSTKQARYPVETLVENSGDCDQLSYIAASIMKAGGLDVVLLFYEKKSHMNVGINLPNEPRDARTPAYYVTYNGTRYYIAECTGEKWKEGWRVGECPSDLTNEEMHVITLENCEQWSPGQVSASYKTLIASTINLEVSSTFVFQESKVTISGQLSPSLQNETITLYFKTSSSPWSMLTTATTDCNGSFTCFLNLNETGLYYVRASWSGNSDYMGADSPIISITSLSILFIGFLIIAMSLICIGAVAFLMTRQSYTEIEDSQIPEVPSLIKKEKLLPQA